MYRKSNNDIEILLGHMGGPYWARKDEGSWTIPKGEFNPNLEAALNAAIREFKEETGLLLKGPFIPLPSIVQRGGKKIWAWACEGDLDPACFESNTFEMEWPPRSGRVQTFPELDRVEWFSREQAEIKILKSQKDLLQAFYRLIVQ